MRLLLETDLAEAVDAEGETALAHTGLGRDERRVLASIPPKLRERLGHRVRGMRANKADEQRQRRQKEIARFLH